MEKKIDIEVQKLTKELALDIYNLQKNLNFITQNIINSYIDSTSSICITCRCGGMLIGFLLANNLTYAADLEYIYVDVGYRKMECATLMIFKLFEIIKPSNIPKVMLEVRVSNIPAIGLYKKLGFKTINIRKKYYKDNLEDAFVMEKYIKN